MASLNKCQIIGNLGRDPEVRYSPDGSALATVSVATSYKSKDRNTGEQKEYTEWHRIIFFGRLAEIVDQYLRKGSSIYVEGRLQTRKFTDKDGVERWVTEIIGENMQMLGGGQGGPAPPARQSQGRTQGAQRSTGRPAPAPSGPDIPNDDIPF